METGAKQTIKFLIAIADEKLRTHLANYVEKHFSDTVIYEAKDGSEGLQKIESDPPHVAILDARLARRSTRQIIDLLFIESKYAQMQVIIVYPDNSFSEFADEAATGRLQLVRIEKNLESVVAALYQAINRANPDNKDFNKRFIRKGELLLKEGERGDRLYILKRGKLSAFLGQLQSPKVLGHIIPGEFVGEMAYINGEPRVASVVADEDSELVEFSIATFDQILYRKPSWIKALLSTLSKRVKELNLRRAA